MNVCIVALGAYPLINKAYKEDKKGIGGPSVHQFLLAKELSINKCQVTVIAYKEGNPSFEKFDRINVITFPKVNYKSAVLSKLVNLIYLWISLFKARSDVYFNAGGITIAISSFCKLMRKKYIYEIASDAWVNKGLITKHIKKFNRSTFSLDRIGNYFDIVFSNAIIVQSEFQKRMLELNYKKNSTIIKICFPLSKETHFENSSTLTVLWVGSISEVKQPDLFLKLAEQFPSIKFQMIGGCLGEQDLYYRIKTKAQTIPNIEFLGVVPFHKINDYYLKSDILVNTSMFEGFPNAFIQAWMNYVPVVSLNANPDKVICTNNLGFHSKTFDQLVKDVRTLIEDETLRYKIGENCRRYVEKDHDLSKNILQYLDVFKTVAVRVGE